MTPKEKYKILCETEEYYIPLFLQYWWMEAVCQGKEWDVVLSEHDHTDKEWTPAHVKGAMPYLIGQKMGFRYVLQPQLTQYNGPVYFPPEGIDEIHRLQFEKEVGQTLIEKLRHLRLSYFEQNFAPSVTNWLPFYWGGFRQTTRYTYRINDIGDTESVFAHFDRDKRQKKILKAQQRLSPTEDITPEQFADFHERYWHSRGEKDLLSQSFIIRIVATAVGRGQGILMGLKDSEGTLQAARFVVYDRHCAYSLLSALNPQGHDNGASPLLFWTIIQRLRGKTRSFDFEGSMDAGIEYSYRLYGATQTPYFNISKCNSPLFAMLMRIKGHK